MITNVCTIVSHIHQQQSTYDSKQADGHRRVVRNCENMPWKNETSRDNASHSSRLKRNHVLREWLVECALVFVFFFSFPFPRRAAKLIWSWYWLRHRRSVVAMKFCKGFYIFLEAAGRRMILKLRRNFSVIPVSFVVRDETSFCCYPDQRLEGKTLFTMLKFRRDKFGFLNKET